MSDIFGSGGRLEAAHPSYERRDGQDRMALAVEAALREGRNLLIEAGTGVGKTLAYLVPAALSGRRVIVSTGTKNLQDQIIDKDLPFVIERLGIPVTATVVKGRDNYLCLRRFRDYDREPRLPTIQESEAYENVREWAGRTESGERSEAPGLPEDASFWRRINARGDTCTGQRCEDYEACFLTGVRRRAEQSRIVIVNHHLFFADLALRGDAFGKVLPDYDAVVFDEAHQLEEVATLFFGVSCSSARVLDLADDAARALGRAAAGGGGREGGSGTDGGFDPDDDWDDGSAAGSGRGGARRASGEGGQVAGGRSSAPMRRADRRGRSKGSGRGGRGIARDSDGNAGSGAHGRGGRDRARAASCPEADGVRQAAALFFGPMAGQSRRTLDAQVRGSGFEERREALAAALDRLRRAAEAVSPPTDESAALERRCREISGQIEFIARGDDERYVYWTDARGRAVTLSASPVDVSSILEEALFSSVHAAVLTSATLSVGGSFSFVRERLGIAGADEEIVRSPFDYESQAVLYLPAAMPEPRSAAWPARMLREIEALIEISRGRAFLLFTSHAELRRVEEALRGRTRHPILVQGEMPRARLLEEFRRTRGAILLGAASFWHGVDVVGEALSLVVIDKIPFDVPSDPLIAARIGRIRALGGEPFNDYQVPSAAIELKQGLGRLIRSRADRGILAVLDGRLRSRGYGSRLLEALPPFPIVSDIEQVREFFQGRAH